MKLFRQCVSALNWQIMVILGIVTAGLIACGIPSALFAGSLPILAVVACLLPCLIPIALLKRKSRPQVDAQVICPPKKCTRESETILYNSE